jgi:hypothetical protein
VNKKKGLKKKIYIAEDDKDDKLDIANLDSHDLVTYVYPPGYVYVYIWMYIHLIG